MLPQLLTILMASSREPPSLNSDSMISLNFGSFSSANITGAVRLPLARSLPEGFPSCSADCVKSKMSSTIWKDRPRFLPYSYIFSVMPLSAPLKIAAPLELAAIKDAVL
ncbi:hypothetical protein V8G54_026159 [Vigna mungo]|uniref:Uncharacterized protein n=1 Tax=Vigna mungo TaxID=3915 RepID=A0AAQ3MY95_VIGMU